MWDVHPEVYITMYLCTPAGKRGTEKKGRTKEATGRGTAAPGGGESCDGRRQEERERTTAPEPSRRQRRMRHRPSLSGHKERRFQAEEKVTWPPDSQLACQHGFRQVLRHVVGFWVNERIVCY